jgi:hypothetical protein
MKLRIRGNSLRFRLTKSEVAQFVETGLIEESIEFGAEESQRFVYALAVSAGKIGAPHAALENNRITIFLPAQQAEEWAKGEMVGISAEQKISGNKRLQILIEKDFACLEARPGEDETDAFPHPLADEKAC